MFLHPPVLSKSNAFAAKGKSKWHQSVTTPRRASVIGGQCEFPLCNGRNGVPMLIIRIKHKATGWSKQYWVCAKTMREYPERLLSTLDNMKVIPLEDWALDEFQIEKLIKYADGQVFPWEPSMINTKDLRK